MEPNTLSLSLSLSMLLSITPSFLSHAHTPTHLCLFFLNWCPAVLLFLLSFLHTYTHTLSLSLFPPHFLTHAKVRKLHQQQFLADVQPIKSPTPTPFKTDPVVNFQPKKKIRPPPVSRPTLKKQKNSRRKRKQRKDSFHPGFDGSREDFCGEM